MTSRPNKWIKQARIKLIEEFGDHCSECNATNKLVFHHTMPTDLKGPGRGRKERYYDVVENKGAYILLCQKCHLKVHGLTLYAET